MTAIGSRPCSISTCATVMAAPRQREQHERVTEHARAPPPPPATTRRRPATRPGRPRPAGDPGRCQTAAIDGDEDRHGADHHRGVADAGQGDPDVLHDDATPTPKHPSSRMAGVEGRPQVARGPGRPGEAAASPNRTTVSHPGCSQSSDSLDRAMLEPQSSPAAVRAGTGGGCSNGSRSMIRAGGPKIAHISPSANYYSVLWLSRLMKLTFSC